MMNDRPSEAQVQFIAAIIREAKQFLKIKWTKMWKEETKGRYFFRLIPAPTKAVLALYSGLPKAMSSIGVQFRTEKIGLGDFFLATRSQDSIFRSVAAAKAFKRSNTFFLRARDGPMKGGVLLVLSANVIWPFIFILETGFLGQFRSYMEKLKTI